MAAVPTNTSELKAGKDVLLTINAIKNFKTKIVKTKGGKIQPLGSLQCLMLSQLQGNVTVNESKINKKKKARELTQTTFTPVLIDVAFHEAAA